MIISPEIFLMDVLIVLIIDFSNPDLIPGLRLIFELRNALLCLQSDKKNNHEKELICFKLDLILGYRKEKILRIKDDLIQEFNSKNDELKKIEDSEKKDKLLEKISNISNEIYSIKLSLFDVCPFTCNQIELRNNDID